MQWLLYLLCEQSISHVYNYYYIQEEGAGQN